ncbi:MAG TPA: hypothetical protein PLG50_11085 [bacterium]|nr:hypothetical protein [bacterium]HQJ64298.1 hypothetical protein [bacterium]
MSALTEREGGTVAGWARRAKTKIKYHVDLIAMRREIERLFSELGGRTFELLSSDPGAEVGRDPEIQHWMEKLKHHEAMLAALKSDHRTATET